MSYYFVEANYWWTQSIARPLCNRRATCIFYCLIMLYQGVVVLFILHYNEVCTVQNLRLSCTSDRTPLLVLWHCLLHLFSCYIQMMHVASLSLNQSDTCAIKVSVVHPLSDVDSCRRLRSASTAEVLVPATQRITIGDRALAIAGPHAWNNLPVDLSLSRTFSAFKTHLKSHLFNVSFPSVWLYHWPFLYRALEAACAAYASLNLSLLHYITLPRCNRHLVYMVLLCWRLPVDCALDCSIR